MKQKIWTNTEIIDTLVTDYLSTNKSTQEITDFIDSCLESRNQHPSVNQIIFESDICLDLFIDRITKYGEAWCDARLSSIVDYVIMKYHRLTNLTNDPIKNIDKIESDLRDAANYALMGLAKIHELKVEQNINKE